MLRYNEIKNIKETIKRKKPTLILGRRGSGKTWILSHLKGIYVEYPRLKMILSAIIKSKDLYTERDPRYLTVAELLDIVRPSLSRTVLLLDEFNDARRPVIKFIEKLIAEGATVVAAAERKPWTGCFRETIDLGPMPRAESIELIYKNISETHHLAVDIIVTKSLGYPGKIMELTKAYNLGIKNYDVDPWNKNSIVNFFLEQKPEFQDKIDLLPFEYLFIIGFGALFLKLIYWEKGDWRTGYMLGGIGYLTLITWRTLWRKKRY